MTILTAYLLGILTLMLVWFVYLFLEERERLHHGPKWNP